MSRPRIPSPMQQEFTRLPARAIGWYSKEATRLGASRASLYRRAILAWMEGARGVVLDAQERAWVELLRAWRGIGGDRETLEAITILAARAFVSADLARRLRDLAAEVAPMDRKTEPVPGETTEEGIRRLSLRARLAALPVGASVPPSAEDEE